MGLERHFLDWEQPLLASAVARLTSAWTHGFLDLRGTLVIVPTRQSGRRLQETLSAWAAERQTGLLPPEIITPDRLLRRRENDRRVPNRAEESLLWTALLRVDGLDDVPTLFPRPPRETLEPRWAVNLARRLCGLRRQLAENGLRIRDCLAVEGAVDEERERWQDLARLEEGYLKRLAASGRKDTVLAMREAAAEPEVPAGIRRILVVGVPDPMPLVLRPLTVLAATLPVEIWIHAPDTLAEAFDDFGRPRPSAWEKHDLALAPDTLRVAGGPRAQANDLVGVLAGFSGQRADVDFAVAVLREELFATVGEALDGQGIVTYDPAGRPVSETPPARLLRDLAAVHADPAFAPLAQLLRNPDLLEYLGRRNPGLDVHLLLADLDRLQNEYLPQTRADLDHAITAFAVRNLERARIVRDTLAELDALLAKFADLPFPRAIREVLAAVFAERRPGDAAGEKAFRLAAETVVRMVEKFESDVAAVPEVPVEDRFAILFDLFAQEPIYPEHPGNALDLQGWLELPWESAPRLVLVGMNDGNVPEAVIGDAFLPDRTRTILGLPDNRQRFARDAFLFRAMTASRAPEAVTCIIGKTDTEGSPLRPSRLFFLCDDGELPARAGRLFGEPPPETGDQTVQAEEPPWRLRVPAAPPLDHLSVTAFRDYLQCPFRFHLKHGLRMEHLDDRKLELDSLDFGTLCHDVLHDFGRDGELRESTDAQAIKAFLMDRIDVHLHGRFGGELPLAVFVQAESLRQRLATFAEAQAQERADGWRIAAPEQSFGKDGGFILGGLPVHGRIDRIEEHADGRIRVLDYKTSDTAATPAGTHLAPGDADRDPGYALANINGKSKLWKDLQLPIYRMALAAHYPGRTILCGYFNLPKAVSDTGICDWPELDDALTEAARRCAEAIADRVRRGVFWPPTDRIIRYDDFAELFPGKIAPADACIWEGPTE